MATFGNAATSSALRVLLACFATMALAEEPPRFRVSEALLEGNTVLPANEISGVLASLIGANKTIDDLKKAESRLQEIYLDHGYRAVKVYLPEQEVSEGRVVVRVVEAKVSTVRIEGNKNFDADNIRAAVPALKEGTTPNARAIDAQIQHANESPARQLSLGMLAAPKAGEIDARLTVTDDNPEKRFLTLDDTGNSATGYYRLGLGYQNANLLGRDHVATLAATISPEQADRAYSFVGSYRIPDYGRGLTWEAYAAYSNSSFVANPAIQLNTGSTGIIAGGKLTQRLQAPAGIQFKLNYGIEHRDFTCEQSIAGSSQQDCIGLPDVYYTNGSFGPSLQLVRPGIQLNGSLTYYASDRRNDVISAKSVATGSANIALPASWQLRLNTTAQWSSHSLLAYERIGVGGASSVRGYAEGQVRGDEGYWSNLEVHTPDVGPLLPVPNLGLRLIAFHDRGQVHLNAPAAGEESKTSLSSTGVGFHLNLGRHTIARFDWAQVQNDIHLSPARRRGDTRGHLSVMQSF